MKLVPNILLLSLLLPLLLGTGCVHYLFRVDFDADMAPQQAEVKTGLGSCSMMLREEDVPGKEEESPVHCGDAEPDCFHWCTSAFNACSSDVHPGDFSRCVQVRRACERDCGQRREVRQDEQREDREAAKVPPAALPGGAKPEKKRDDGPQQQGVGE